MKTKNIFFIFFLFLISLLLVNKINSNKTTLKEEVQEEVIIKEYGIKTNNFDFNKFKIKSGETFSDIFDRYHVHPMIVDKIQRYIVARLVHCMAYHMFQWFLYFFFKMSNHATPNTSVWATL